MNRADRIVVEKESSNKSIKYDIQLTPEQKEAKGLILSRPFNFILGKAGSGKTLLSCAIALDMLFKKNIEHIIITRPTVSTEDNGFLPGSLEEKMDPWLVPIYSNFLKIYNKREKIEKMKQDGQIELVSLTHFRGRTFDNAICIVDEFQNLTKSQLLMVLGRLGKNSSMYLTGDPDQIDLKYNNDSAYHCIEKLTKSQYVNKIVLKDNHRHPALDEVLSLLMEKY